MSPHLQPLNMQLHQHCLQSHHQNLKWNNTCSHALQLDANARRPAMGVVEDVEEREPSATTARAPSLSLSFSLNNKNPNSLQPLINSRCDCNPLVGQKLRWSSVNPNVIVSRMMQLSSPCAFHSWSYTNQLHAHRRNANRPVDTYEHNKYEKGKCGQET